ncbi:protein ACCELERATED CELL DEATH 6-like [Oryza brachyantha]|uniref:protein ACCELERATED CELL DEATH 6-like n=1 Tax=Oryza brachyantha TaxID=4533 RepID=UPI001ADD1425|nr:protein ACCELERATED CELL DEATH 6-like [Oryza brachyantha]
MAAGADPPVHRDAKLMMANGRGECQMLKDLVNKEDPAMMMVVMAASNSGPSAAATASPPVVAAMHPLLLASACSGDWKAINFLLNRAEAQADPAFLARKENVWIVDSGCSRHMTGDKSWFSSLVRASRKDSIIFSDASTSTITATGSVKSGILDKFESRSRDGLILGYAAHSRGYRVLVLETNKIVETCEVTFDEASPGTRPKISGTISQVQGEDIFVEESDDEDDNELSAGQTGGTMSVRPQAEERSNRPGGSSSCASDPSKKPSEEFLNYLERYTSSSINSSAAGSSQMPLPAAALSAESILRSVTIEGDTVLHVVATHGDHENFLECAKLIYERAQHLLFKTNGKGNTPLHCASRSGNYDMAYRLYGAAKSTSKGAEYLRMENGCKETALHEAVRKGNNRIVEFLMRGDSELARLPKEGMSPLYLAILLKNYVIATTIHDIREDGLVSYAGLNGQNALHAAVLQDRAVTELLLRWKPSLTEQADQNGSTPLHFAASRRVEGRGCMWKSRSTVVPVLQENRFQLYRPDSEGSYPIHVAASSGARQTVIYFIKERPEIAGFRDSKGRTFLHVAVEKDRRDVVRHACNTRSLAWILNMQDNDGNTAIHIASQQGLMLHFSFLLMNRGVNLNIQNNKGQTPLDISHSKIPAGFFYAWNPENVILSLLKICNAMPGSLRADHLQEQYSSQQKHEDKVRESEKLSSSSQTLGLGSVLIVTVTFGATFALPGGYKSDDHYRAGTPTLAGRYCFDAFIMANTLAFICSVLATINLMYSGISMVNLPSRRWHFKMSSLLVAGSVTSLGSAFALGMYLVLIPVSPAIAATICALMVIASLWLCMEPWYGFLIGTAVYFRIGNQALLGIAQIFIRRMVIIYWPCILIFGWVALSRTTGHN